MSRRRGTLVAAFILGIAGIPLVWHYWPDRPEPARSPPPIESAVNSSPTSQPPTEPRIAVPTPSPLVPIQAEPDQRKEQQWAAFFQTPITVHGKVVDEQGNPIPDANVEISVNDNPNTTKAVLFHRESTNSDGLFTLTNVNGIGFSVSANKSGYYKTNQSTGVRNVVAPNRQDIPPSSKEKPIVLVLRKQGQTVPLIAARSGQINVPKTGEPIAIDLATGRSGTGDLKVASWVGNGDGDRFDWRYQLSIPSGGLAARASPMDFVAPDNGYQTTTEIDMPATAPNWSFDGEKDYFAKLPDGRFARFSIKFYPRGQRNFVVFESYVNPQSGDRNLEFDPAKQVNSH